MNLDLTGKTAVVTGGNVGLGRATALALAQAGAVLFLASDLASFITGEVTEINGGAWFV